MQQCFVMKLNIKKKNGKYTDKYQLIKNIKSKLEKKNIGSFSIYTSYFINFKLNTLSSLFHESHHRLIVIVVAS